MTKIWTPLSCLHLFDYGNLNERSELYIDSSPTPYKNSKLCDFIVS